MTVFVSNLSLGRRMFERMVLQVIDALEHALRADRTVFALNYWNISTLGV